MAAHWDEERWKDDELDELSNPMLISKRLKDEKKAKMREQTLKALLKQKFYLSQQQQSQLSQQNTLSSSDETTNTLININNDHDSSGSSNDDRIADVSSDTSLTQTKKIKSFPDVNNSSNRSKMLSKLTKRVVREHIHLDKSSMKYDPRPIDVTCKCYTCRNFNRAYLHHLFRAKELIGPTLVTIHNIHFMNRLMKDIRHGE